MRLSPQTLRPSGPGASSRAPSDVSACALPFPRSLEYWNLLASDLYHTECQFQPPTQSALVLSPLPPHAQTSLSPTASPRRQLYSPVLSKLRVLLVSRMAKPEEVLIVEDENGTRAARRPSRCGPAVARPRARCPLLAR